MFRFSSHAIAVRFGIPVWQISGDLGDTESGRTLPVFSFPVLFDAEFDEQRSSL